MLASKLNIRPVAIDGVEVNQGPPGFDRAQPSATLPKRCRWGPISVGEQASEIGIALPTKRPNEAQVRYQEHVVQQSFNRSEVVKFWVDAGSGSWFRKDAAFDDRFREKFAAAHEAAARGHLDDWLTNGEGALALLILLDQYPRNSFRGTARMFATDTKALNVAKQAITSGFDVTAEPSLRLFFYTPFIHSERIEDQDRALDLYAQLGGDTAHHAHIHRDIIVKFGRFPHRNPLLRRDTTAEEQQFLDDGGFAG